MNDSYHKITPPVGINDLTFLFQAGRVIFSLVSYGFFALIAGVIFILFILNLDLGQTDNIILTFFMGMVGLVLSFLAVKKIQVLAHRNTNKIVMGALGLHLNYAGRESYFSYDQIQALRIETVYGLSLLPEKRLEIVEKGSGKILTLAKNSEFGSPEKLRDILIHKI